MRIIPVGRAVRLASVAALASAAVVVVAGPARSATPITTVTTSTTVACQRTYLRTLNMVIPDNSSIVDELDVPEDGLVVSDVDVHLDIHHPDATQLDIGVLSREDTITPRVPTVEVYSHVNEGRNEVNVLGTVLDDSASTPITWGDGPYTGRFKPTRSLAPLNGFAGGMYDIDVDDGAPGNTGTFNDWGLTFRYKSCDFDGDGVEDHHDSCLGAAGQTKSGCPLTTRKLRASYSGGRFKGSLSSPVAGCKASRVVSVWKVHSGPDTKIGTARTRASGSWSFARARSTGAYYATSARGVVPRSAECPASTSKPFTLH